MGITVNTETNTVVISQSGTAPDIVRISASGPSGRDGTSGTSGTSVDTGSLATTGSNTFNGEQIISGSLTVIGGFTASLEQGYAWVGGEGGISVQTPTSSFGGGSGAGFPYIGEAEITGSLDVTDSITTQLFLNPQILNGIILIPVGYNGLLIGPVAAGGELAISSGSTLVTI
jgi:hypothetical protein